MLDDLDGALPRQAARQAQAHAAAAHNHHAAHGLVGAADGAQHLVRLLAGDQHEHFVSRTHTRGRVAGYFFAQVVDGDDAEIHLPVFLAEFAHGTPGQVAVA